MEIFNREYLVNVPFFRIPEIALTVGGQQDTFLSSMADQNRFTGGKNDAFTRHSRMKMSIPEFSVNELDTLCMIYAAYKSGIVGLGIWRMLVKQIVKFAKANLHS